MHTLQILFAASGTALGVYGPLVIVVVAGPDRPSSVRRAVDEIARLRRTTHQRELHYLYVAGEHAEVPSAESRAIAAGIAQHVDASMGVHEGEGFRASVVRAVVTSIGMLSGRMPEIVVSVQDATDKLAARHATVGPAEGVRTAIAELRLAAVEG